MWLRASALLAICVLSLVSCSGDAVEPTTTIAPANGAASSMAAVEELVAAINEPDFAAASRYAVPGQAALASLAEGATFGAVAEALREGDEEIAANFWSGFAQGAGAFLTGSIDLGESGPTSEGDVEFYQVSVTPSDGESRTVLLRDVDGYRVDLFASFGQGLADKMTPQVERLLTTQTADARLILSRLQEIVPSLLVAAHLPGTTAEVTQQILTLVEVITRVG
jgi:hypothetical protein